MSAVTRPMTLEAFLDWESRQELKYEFDGFQPVAMTGGTAAHSAIQVNLMGLLFNRLRGHRCRVARESSEDPGRGPHPLSRCVYRLLPRFAQRTGCPRPGRCVFEILSPTTFDTDHFENNLEYRDTPSIQRYVMLEQSRRGATVFCRAGDDWIGHVVTGEDDLALPRVGITLPMVELYEGVTFPPGPGEALTA